MIRILAILIGLILAAAPAGAAMTPDEAERLAQAGLSPETLGVLNALHAETGRQRKPLITADAAGKLLAAGVSDEALRLLAGLDWLTLDSKSPVGPDQALVLTTSGVSDEALRVLLAAEIAKRGGAPQAPAAAATPPAPPESPGGPPPIPGLRLNSHEYRGADGKSVIVYQSPFEPDRPVARLGRTEIPMEGGRRVILYTSADALGEGPRRHERREEWRKRMDDAWRDWATGYRQTR